LADQAEEADAARAAEDATASRTKITASLRGSRANRAGNFLFHGSAGRQGQGLAALCCEEKLMTTTFQAPERNEAHRKAQNEGRKARAAKLDKPAPAKLPTIRVRSDDDWNHSNEISSQE